MQGIPPPPEGSIQSASSPLLREVLLAYQDFLLHQGVASSALVRWTRSSRALDFAWLGGAATTETLILGGRELEVARSSPLFESVKKMHTTAVLNPYEREVLYGYPFVVGREGGKAIRGPLLSIAVEIVPKGDGYTVLGREESLRFNGLPFRIDQRDAVDLAISTLAGATPSWPTDRASLDDFVTQLRREFPHVVVPEALDGTLDEPPSEPRKGEFLSVVSQAAIFVAPRSNYFLTSDLGVMAETTDVSSVLDAIMTGAADESGPDFSNDQLDGAALVFPFPSNRAQRRIALLLDDADTSIVRVEGPPGTGKSLTIANVACHLAATGRSVLITSQKDKALSVVDEKLRQLGVRGFPITLLRHDKDAKKELLDRLADASRKERASTEVQAEIDELRADIRSLASEYAEAGSAFDEAAEWEERVFVAAQAADGVGGVRGVLRRLKLRSALRKADHESPLTTGDIASTAHAANSVLRRQSRRTLETSAELGVALATQAERQQLRQLEQLLRRNQKNVRNYHLFDRLKADPERARMFLRLLPVWIMAPDDVARLFPADAGLFDVVIVDEASQVDLPSVFPVLQRAKKLVVSGDTKQMQPKRFSFVPGGVGTQAWQKVREFDDDLVGLLNPTDMSLLELAFVRAQEENLLDEHFRSLPPIIDFSNDQWYRGRLRVMTDERRKRFGTPEQPVMQLHHAENGRVSEGLQENLEEAKALVDLLARLVVDPDYTDASIGVLCLFADQVVLVQELVASTIDEAEWAEHDLVVVNPDGFQGDERDVILYSLSFDDEVMPRAAISARQQDSPHVQGMLNVAFTRARDEVHVFHSAPIDRFFKEDGSGTLGDWLEHVHRVEQRPREAVGRSRQGRTDSEFEVDVAEELRKRGVAVTHQYQACGYFIDLMCELNGVRVGVECDGPTHFDEHGRRRIEDLERLGVLRRANWTIVNIPYRQWLRAPGEAIQAAMDALEGRLDGDVAGDGDGGDAGPGSTRQVSAEQDAVFRAIKAGSITEDEVFRSARDLLGRRRLTGKLREELRAAALDMNHQGLLVIEEGEYFLTPEGRATTTKHVKPPQPAVKKRATSRHKTSRKASPGGGACACGGRFVVRNGRYGKFYGCSRYPRCRRTKDFR